MKNRRSDCPYFHVRKRTLLAIAGCVWLAAGFNVARLGVLSYLETGTVIASCIWRNGILIYGAL